MKALRVHGLVKDGEQIEDDCEKTAGESAGELFYKELC